MVYQHGKAIEGGTPLTAEELDSLARDQISAMREVLKPRATNRKSGDVIDRRLAEELRLARRVLELLEYDARKRGDTGSAKALGHAENAIEDIAEVVESEDRCATLDTIDEDMARRIKRRSVEGGDGPCDPAASGGAANSN